MKSLFYGTTKRQKAIRVLLLLSIISYISCNNADDNENIITRNEISVSQVISSLGTPETLADFKTISYDVEGSSFEYGQDGPYVEFPINDSSYKYGFSSELSSRKAKLEYSFINYKYPFQYYSNGTTLIVNDLQGSISGEYDLRSIYVGFTEATALHASRIEAILKLHKMANPLELLKEIAVKYGSSYKTKTNSFLVPTGIEGLDIEVFIDKDTFLPVKSVVKESDYLLGDILFKIVYSDWTTIDGFLMPAHLDHYINEDRVRSESISNIKINPQLTQDHFEVETSEPRAYNLVEAKDGIYFSQWYIRLFYQSIPLDQPLNIALAMEDQDLSQFNVGSQYISENIKIIGRPDVSIWPVAIKTASGVYIVDSPVSEKWAKSVLNVVANKFPSEPVVGVIPSHIHNTHFAGIRKLAAEGGNIYVGSGGVEFTNFVLGQPHSLVPDTMSRSGNTVNIIEIDKVTYLDGGAVEIHPFAIPDAGVNPHAEDLTVVYVPAEKVLIQTDFFYAGVSHNIFSERTPKTFSEEVKQSLKLRAQYLLNFIQQKNLDVTKIIALHGGVATLEEVRQVADY